MMQEIKQWYAELDKNDQRVVLIAIVFFSFIILFFGILKPLGDSVNKLQVQVNSREKSVEKWQQSMPAILASRGNGKNAKSTAALSFIVTSTTKQFKLRVSRVQEKSDNEMQVWFDNVSFNNFVSWLAQIEKKYSINTVSVNVRNKSRNGLTSIDIKIRKE